MARAIPIRGAMGTLFYVILFILSFLVLYFFGDTKSPMFYFLGGLTLWLLLAIVTCFDNLGKYNKLVEKSEAMRNTDVTFTRCPDYWRKRVVTNPMDSSKVYMCSNEYAPGKFVSGSLVGEGTGRNEYMNFTVDEMRAKAKYDENDDSSPAVPPPTTSPPASPPPATETFVAGPGKKATREGFRNLPRDHPDYDKYAHTHTNIDMHVHRDVRAVGDNKYATPHTHMFRRASVGTHSHYGTEGSFWEGETEDANMYDAKYNNFNHWLNPLDTEGTAKAMEINLNKLNTAENKCELANTFPWTQAYTACAN